MTVTHEIYTELRKDRDRLDRQVRQLKQRLADMEAAIRNREKRAQDAGRRQGEVDRARALAGRVFG